MLQQERAGWRQDDGMATVEYAVGLIVAVTMAVVMLKIVNGGAVSSALTAIVKRALDMA